MSKSATIKSYDEKSMSSVQGGHQESQDGSNDVSAPVVLLWSGGRLMSSSGIRPRQGAWSGKDAENDQHPSKKAGGEDPKDTRRGLHRGFGGAENPVEGLCLLLVFVFFFSATEARSVEASILCFYTKTVIDKST